jgi:folate-binding protein YgfZ
VGAVRVSPFNKTIWKQALQARETGFLARLDGSGPGMAQLGSLQVTGKDAPRFLHSQLTNDVEGLAEGEGNLSARTTRTGHLRSWMSVHRLPCAVDQPPTFLLLLEQALMVDLREDLDAFLFSDDVQLEAVTDNYHWLALQGPCAMDVANEAALSVTDGFPLAKTNAVAALSGQSVPANSLVFQRSLAGDTGIILALKCNDDTHALPRLEAVAHKAGLCLPDPAEFADLLEVLRIEAGLVQVGTDTPGRDRLLPETGLEAQVVSYSKGCYLGQEVIARVRTYGSLPFTLRGLVFESDTLEHAQTVLQALPDTGEALLLTGGESIGQLVSTTLSPTMQQPVAMAYIDRSHRTPGTELEFSTDGGTLKAKVVLLPFYRTPDTDERAAYLYDEAIRIFADGREDDALDRLEEALRLDPTHKDAYEAVGVILARSGRFHEAIDIFTRLEDLAPMEPMVNTNLSLYYMKIGDKATAEEHSAKALQKGMFGNSSRALSAAEMAAEHEAGQRRDAEAKKEMFRQVMEIDPEDSIALFGLGSAHLILGEWNDAARILEQANRVDPKNSAVYLARGKALEKLDHTADAVEVYKQGMDVASKKGDLMPLKEMEQRRLLLMALSKET